MSFIPHVICVELWDLIKIDISWTKIVECSFIKWLVYHIVAEFMGFIIRYDTTNNASKASQQSNSDPPDCQPWAIGIRILLLLFCLIQSFYLTNDLIKVSFLYLTVFYFVFSRFPVPRFSITLRCATVIPFTHIYTHWHSLIPDCDWFVGILWLYFLFMCVELSCFVAER